VSDERTVEWMRAHLLALIRGGQNAGVLHYECDRCHFVANPENFGDTCKVCGGTCIPVFTDKSEPATSNYFTLLEEKKRLEAELCEIRRGSMRF
jgi:rubredoxin